MRLKTRKLLGAATALSLLASSLTGCGSAVVSLTKGDCLDLPADFVADGVFDPEKLLTVSCGKPHNAEVIDTLSLSGESFPGAHELSEQAGTFCSAAFTLYIGTNPSASILDLAPLVPTEESWTKGKDRLVVCLAVSQHEKISRSVKNAQR